MQVVQSGNWCSSDKSSLRSLLLLSISLVVSAYSSVQYLPIVTNSGSDIQITFLLLLTVQSLVLLLVFCCLSSHKLGPAVPMRQFSDSVYPADVHDAHLLTCQLSSA